ncbi:MAG: leucine-rich repeat protein [Kiritimatiellia bacterium]
MASRLWLAGLVSAGLLSAGSLWAGWVSTGTANEYTDGYWTITLSGNALAKVVAGGSDAADMDLTSFEADTGVQVTSINNSVFIGNALIVSFIGPDVTAVGQSAFLNSGVKKIVLSPQLNSLQNRAFCGCGQLTEFFPTTIWVEELPAWAINGWKAAVDLEFPVCKRVTAMGASFPGNISLTGVTSIRMPEVETVDNIRAFQMNSSLTNLYLPKLLSAPAARFAYNCGALVDVTISMGEAAAVESEAFSGVSAGCEIKWLGEVAPTELGEKAFYPKSAANPPRIILKSAKAEAGWRALCARVRQPREEETALTDDDLALASYPGDKTIGLIDDSNGNKAWVIRDWTGGTVILMR